MLESVEVGDIKIHDVQAIVAERGALDTSLLGMSFIGRLQSFQMSGKRLVLVN
jgi:aspartyl protease family protein